MRATPISPTRPPIASTVATQTSTSSSTSSTCSASDNINILPLRQLRTALLSERFAGGGGGGVKTQRAFSDVNPPWSQPDFLAHAADLVHLASASMVASPEKAALRLPAKKRKFDWGERSHGNSPVASAQAPPPPASLIVDKPAHHPGGGGEGGGDVTRRSSILSFAEPSASLLHYPTAQRDLTAVKQRKLSYPDLSFSSDSVSTFASLRPPPPVPAFSGRADG